MAIRAARSWWWEPRNGDRPSHQPYGQVPQASAQAASTRGGGRLSGGLRVVLGEYGMDVEWLGWWLLGIGGSWRDLEEL